MATLYTHQESNNVKTWFLMSFMFAIIVAVGWFLSYYFGNSLILYISVALSLVLNITSYWYSDKIALSMSHAEPAAEEQYRELHRIVENLSLAAGLPKPRVYIINDAVPNAFATGRNKNHAAVAVTKGLINLLDRSELEGVIAHELAHIGNKDILISTIAVVLAGFLSIISDMFLRASIFGGSEENRGGPMVLIGIALVLLSPIAGLLIQMAISRKREFLADATGSLITRYPEGLAKALEKISSYEAPMQNAHNATAHLYISNPFGARALKGVHALFMTHPPVEARIKALRDLTI